MAFAYLATASVVAAVLAITRRNPVHSVLWALALFVHVAGIYLMAGAQFLAATQIIIYAGAILVFYLIILMLLDWTAEGAAQRYGAHWVLGVAASLGFIAVMVFALRSSRALAGRQPQINLWQPSVAEFGVKLFRGFAVPFEVASLILLAAIVGAVVLARRKTPLAQGTGTRSQRNP
ncbi:MAG: NADH-quinone oxidoreductase subunit J [Elusimicrobiota bacterium]